MARTVLIADDSASMRLSVRLLLEGRHTELVVREAVDGIDAIEKAKRSRPDLIHLDLAMPRLNGAEAATILKNAMPETPVILFTMYTDLLANSLCAANGVSKLLERVDALLGLLMLRTSTVRSNRVGHARYSRKYFEDDATVEHPEKISDQRCEQREQSLHWGLLERQQRPRQPRR